VTVGNDGEIRIWNFSQKQMGFSLNIEIEKAKIIKNEQGPLNRLYISTSVQERRNSSYEHQV